MPPVAVSTGMLELTICPIWTGAFILVKKDGVVNFWPFGQRWVRLTSE